MKIEIRWWQVKKFLYRAVIVAAVAFFLLQMWELVDWVVLGVKLMHNDLKMLIQILHAATFS